MKPSMLFAIIALTTIVMVASFGLQMMPITPVSIPEHMAGAVLYVCPKASPSWDSAALALVPLRYYIRVAFFFVSMLLMFMWGWELYQNLLKDKLDTKSFSKVWGFTKLAFWAGVIAIIVTYTPNHFKTVHIDNAAGEWVLCENTTPGARAVRASMVHP